MTIYDCCMFFNENDLLEMRLNQHWDVVDRFIIIEAGETHTGFKKPFNFDRERFKPYESKLTYFNFDSFDEMMSKNSQYLCPLGNAVHGNHLDWVRGNFQCNYMVKLLREHGARDNDIVYLSSLDELFRKEALYEGLTRFDNKDTHVFESGLSYVSDVMKDKLFRPIFGFHMEMYVYKLNLLQYPDVVVGLLTEVGNFDKLLPATIRSLSMSSHPHIENGGWHFSYLDNTKGEMVLEKHRSWPHARDPVPPGQKRRFDSENTDEALGVLFKEFSPKLVNITEKSHPEYIVKNLDRFQDYILKEEEFYELKRTKNA